MAYAAPFPAAPTRARRSARPVQASIRAQASRPAASPASHPAPSAWRLTRRGRIVLGVVLSVPFVATLMLVGSVQADADTAAGGSAATGVVVVQPGESLWAIAQQIAPAADPREVVTTIRDLNSLGDAAVLPGQALTVPVYSR